MLSDLYFIALSGGLVKLRAAELIGQILLLHIVMREIMSIKIPLLPFFSVGVRMLILQVPGDRRRVPGFHKPLGIPYRKV